MLTKGIITSINLTANTCAVRIPSFETAGTKTDMIYEDAIFAVPPGHYNGYKVGDIVLVGFELTERNNPVIIGKLYLGANKENAEHRGASKIADLQVQNSATLPLSTNLISTTVQQIKNAKSDFKYNTILDIVKEVANNAWEIQNIKDTNQLFSTVETKDGTWVNSKQIYKKTIPFNAETSEIDLKALNIDTIFVDTLHSIYFPNETTQANITTATFDLTTQKLSVPNSSKTGYITICYTKK